MSERFDRALEQIVAVDRDHLEELRYGEHMAAKLGEFAPDASEALELAARAQHVGRWKIPRSDYPMDRAGYKRWRTNLANLHAETAGEILRNVGYPQETVLRTQSLIRKKNLKTDPECQTLEDVICLVFLEHYLADFAKKHDEPKLVSILQRSWVKMSDKGQRAALDLDLPEDLKQLVGRALAAA